ncbi:MAG: hypothetical protein IJF87_11135 [Erysipelotrichaceae bacterium]|nr:hypothetical protein [Erysipelotrichaceae bacterium]
MNNDIDPNNKDGYKYDYGYLICYLPFKAKTKRLSIIKKTKDLLLKTKDLLFPKEGVTDQSSKKTSLSKEAKKELLSKAKTNKRIYEDAYLMNNEFEITARAFLRSVKSSINKHVNFYHLYSIIQKKMKVTLVCDDDANDLCSKIVEEGSKHNFEIKCNVCLTKNKKIKQYIKEVGEYIPESDLVLVCPQVNKRTTINKRTTRKLLNKYPCKIIEIIDKKKGVEEILKKYLTEKWIYVNEINGIKGSNIDQYIGEINKKFLDHHKEKMGDDGTEININDVSFSIYDEKNYKNIGILKVMIRVRFDPKYTDEDKGKALSHLYDIISRNTKNKFDNKKVENFKISTQKNIYADLVDLFNGMPIKMSNKQELNRRFIRRKNKYYELEMKENDWAFNYEDKDRKCYTFAYYTVKDEINNYCKNHSEAKIKEIMYKITRIHENGAIRTYNKNNDIFDLYQDDTSVIWGVSRVGLGAILIQEKKTERDRNIKVLNEDFAFIYEFCLHQKFFPFSLLNHNKFSDVDDDQNLKTRHEKNSIKQYLLRKVEFTSFNEIFCPQIISEFETQDVYDLVREKLEVNRLMEDAKNALDALEAKKSKQINTRNTIFSAILSMFVFPLTVSGYIDKYLSANQTFNIIAELLKEYPIIHDLFLKLIFIGCMLIGGVVWWVTYILTNRYKK